MTNKSICQTDSDGNKHWYRDNKYHREDGPAYEGADGTKYWFRDSKFHREDGPAIEYANGGKEWYYQGTHIDCDDQQQFERLIKLKVFW